ncbi:DUF1501 domain-containing protein [Stratiformator vulcanicus]|uniref:Sulfatase n=1 Tax=Stratiformator vulcanicus TaxID=2527980 RepID=A0A517R1W4_9PLAN|nr:DUF1501 domain-containing protein [Stratiformator vulcanicus]QDT37879.1 hypothetical protein Pan189_22620 [Stratiformator vulcanicus]
MNQPIINQFESHLNAVSRRHFLSSSAMGIGSAALAGLLNESASASNVSTGQFSRDEFGGINGIRDIAPKAKQVIYLFQSGGPSQIELFDHKPGLEARFGQNIPDSVRMGQRLTGFTNKQKTLPVAPSKYQFKKRGDSGATVSELLPHIGSVADDLCFIKSVYTEAINHDPARTFIQTGAQLAGRPSMGTWVTYGLGSECHDLPSFMVLTSIGSCKRTPQPVSSRLWGSGFLPSEYQGVKLQSVGDPILYVSNPEGVDRGLQGRTIDGLSALNDLHSSRMGDPEIEARTKQYEMAFRMQMSVPDLTDINDEPASTFELYGDDAKQRGTFAANCLLARRMVERGVRFVQLYHNGWDHHQNIPRDLPLMCGDVDRASAALIKDLKQRGMLDETLVIWGGEFGRTVFTEGALTREKYGRDHHGRCFTMWMAGGGIKPGTTYGATDDYSYNVAENPVHVHDLQATILHLLGIDHTRLSYRYQGRDFRLTDVHGHVVKGIIS